MTNPDDYRPIALVSCAFKVMAGLLLTSVTASMRDRAGFDGGAMRVSMWPL